MSGKLVSFTLKAALFLLIFNFIMLFIVQFNSAEWFVTLFSVILMILLIVIIQVTSYVKNRRDKQ
ncbi:MAG: hypothetical protein ACLUE6_04020 [Acutalibacteraceae bacterium]